MLADTVLGTQRKCWWQLVLMQTKPSLMTSKIKYSVPHSIPRTVQAPVFKAFFKVTLNCNAAGNCSTENPSFLPKITQQIGQRAGIQSWAPPIPLQKRSQTHLYYHIMCLLHPSRVLPGSPSWQPRFPGVSRTSLAILEAFDLLSLLPKPLPEK